MPNSSTLIIGTAVAVGITVVAVTAVAQSPVEPTQIVAQQTHLKGYFLDNSRDRLLR